MRAFLATFMILCGFLSAATFASGKAFVPPTKNVVCDFSIPTSRGAAEDEKSLTLKTVDKDIQDLFDGQLVLAISETQKQTFNVKFDQRNGSGLTVGTTVRGVIASATGDTSANLSIRSNALKIDIGCQIK